MNAGKVKHAGKPQLCMFIMLLIGHSASSAQTGGLVFRASLGPSYFPLNKIQDQFGDGRSGRLDKDKAYIFGGLSAMRALSENFSLGLGIEYVRTTPAIHPNSNATTQWTFQCIPVTALLEYRLKARPVKFTPIIGVGISYSVGSIKQESDYAVVAIYPHPFPYMNKQANAWGLEGSLGFLIHIHASISLYSAFRYRQFAQAGELEFVEQNGVRSHIPVQLSGYDVRVGVELGI